MSDNSPDPIRFRCPTCKSTLAAEPARAGKRARCPCGQKVLVPVPQAALNKTVLGELLPGSQGGADTGWFLPPEQPSSPLLSPFRFDTAVPSVALPPEIPPLPPSPPWDNLPAETSRPLPDLTKPREEPKSAGLICCNLSLSLGFLSLIVCGIPFGAAGIVLGLLGVQLEKQRKARAYVGIALSFIGLILAVQIVMRASREPVYFYYYEYR